MSLLRRKLSLHDKHQIPKGYGFVTFQIVEDVRNVTDMGTLFLQKQKPNLGPAVKKQAPTRTECSELVAVSGHSVHFLLIHTWPTIQYVLHIIHPRDVLKCRSSENNLISRLVHLFQSMCHQAIHIL